VYARGAALLAEVGATSCVGGGVVATAEAFLDNCTGSIGSDEAVASEASLKPKRTLILSLANATAQNLKCDVKIYRKTIEEVTNC